MTDKLVCDKCGRDDAMIKNEDGVMENVATIAIEDLITVVCETFVESLEEIGYKADRTVKDWYMGLLNEERKEISTSLLRIIEEDIMAHKECKCESDNDSPKICKCGTNECCD